VLVMRRGAAIGAILVAVAAVAVWLVVGGGMGGQGAAGASPTPLPPVPSAADVVAEARVVPSTRATVSGAVPGVVATVAVQEGRRIAAGDTLVQLDAAAAEADVAAAQAALDGARARAAQAADGATQAAAEVDRADAAVAAARARRDQLPSGASSAQKRAANADITAAQAGLRSARAARTGATDAAAAAKADEARAAAALDAAKVALARLTITAPIAGTVADVAVAAGDPVATGQPLVRIAGDDGWTFETTDLTQDQVAAISTGSDAAVTVDGFPDTTIPGRVARIAAVGEDRQGDVVFTVVIEPAGAVPDGLRWNMLASVEIAKTP
jgi:HlyD family secretion protein